jgi:hypothetical protein
VVVSKRGCAATSGKGARERPHAILSRLRRLEENRTIADRSVDTWGWRIPADPAGDPIDSDFENVIELPTVTLR